MSASACCSHEESWMLLPWLVNGRLEAAERPRLEAHLRTCEACTRELTAQRLMRAALTEPERVVYAPGPSFRKLLARIDGDAALPAPAAAQAAPRPQAAIATDARARYWRAAWRPPGLAFAASFVLAVGAAALATTAYRWSLPRYATHTHTPAAVPLVVHVAFAPTLTSAEMQQLLREAGARVVEAPDRTGVYGVAPFAAADTLAAARAPSAAVRALAARLRADPRVRWVEPQPEP